MAGPRKIEAMASCAHCGSVHLKAKGQFLDVVKDAFVRPDRYVWEQFVKRNRSMKFVACPRRCESCQGLSLICPNCSEAWALERLPRPWSKLVCPACDAAVFVTI